MTRFFLSPHLVVDATYVVSAQCLEGQGACDGVSQIQCLLDIGGTPKRLWFDFPDRPTRDATFAALVVFLGISPADVAYGKGEDNAVR